MHSVPFLQQTALFTPEQWCELPPALQSGFRTLQESHADDVLLQTTAAFLRWFAPLASGECRLFLGGNGMPQISGYDLTGQLIEVQIMKGRFVWYLEGVTDDVDVF